MTDNATIGHNSGDRAFQTESVAADQLRAFVQRIERLEEEKAGIAGDMKDVYAEAKGNGYKFTLQNVVCFVRQVLSHDLYSLLCILGGWACFAGAADGVRA